ncbi:MAG: NADPH-dependent F420 reductase [Gammaproteobacteria bacterium]|jgi:NADPH-dependent F420 reductase|nr:NADPH-dependent F420 reductase [Gammaproteobacteria bacterium]
MQKITVVGGSGELGGGLARLWAQAGLQVIIGSRDAARAGATAAEINAELGTDNVSGHDNLAAAAAGDMVVLAVKFAHQRATLELIKPALVGKILVDTTVPLVPPNVARVQLPAEGCAALIAQQTLGADTEVVSAFQNVSASSLRDPTVERSDVLVTGDSPAAREAVVALAARAGFTAWHAGPLANSAAMEALTSVLIFMNKRYSGDHTGIAISGVHAA